MSVFKGYLKDNTNFNQYPAELLIQSGFWIVRYKDNHGNTQQLAWDEKKIIHRKDMSTTIEFLLKDKNEYGFISSDPILIKKVSPKSAIHRWINTNPAFPVVTGISLLLVLGLIGLWFSLPWINDKISNAISIETEKKLGDQMIKAMLEHENVLDTLSFHLNEYYQALQKKSQYEIKISVVNSDIVNAYALPGGNIVVYKGILQKMKSHEALAALLGHESTHIEHRHSLKSISRSLAFTAVIGILFGGHDLSSILASNASKFSGLKYSRSLEEDADQGAIVMMDEKKISMQGMVDLMNALSEKDSAGLQLEFIQTHPLTEKRLIVAKNALRDQRNVIENEKLEKIWEQVGGQLTKYKAH